MQTKIKKVEPYWQALVKSYFKFCIHHFNEMPSFDGSQPRDLHNIVAALRMKAEQADKTWTQELAERMFLVFLNFAMQDNWLRENFLPFNLNRQKDKIFFKIKQSQLKHQQ